MVDGYGEEGAREGADITAEHMVLPGDEAQYSQIARFFEGSTVFITGATGYLGKMFLEKLLRACNVRKVYVLIRPKKGKEVTQRFEELFDGPNMEPLKRLKPQFGQKVELIAGDLLVEGLGVGAGDRERLIQEVDCIILCAATVNFDQTLRLATHINVRSVRDMLHMARQMKGLRALLYISTAFAHCPRSTIEEKFYEPPITGDNLIKLTELLEDDKLDAITPSIIGEWPNTYVFTKAVAEDLCRTEGKGLPIAVFRPSIVIPACQEPVAGWIDNIYGATGVLLAAAVGLLHALRAKIDNVAEMVPADYVINSAIAAMWDAASVKSLQPDKETNKEENDEKEIPVYHFVSSPDTPITWRRFMKLSEKHAPQVPTPLLVWHYFIAIHSSRIAHLLACFFYHTVPAYIVDFISICIGKEPMLVKGYQKIEKFADVISYFAMREWRFTNTRTWSVWRRMNKSDRELFNFSMRGFDWDAYFYTLVKGYRKIQKFTDSITYFSMRQWKFTNANTWRMWGVMNKSDRKLFNFSMRRFDWDAYFYTYVRGGRVYLLKDPMETVPQGWRKYYKLMVAHYALMSFLAFLLYKLVLYLYHAIM